MLFLVREHTSRNNAVALQPKEKYARFTEASDEKLRAHLNGCAHVRGSTRRRPDGEGNVPRSMDSATNARRPARPSGSVDQQHSHALAAPQGARRKRILYGSGIGQYSKAA